MLYGGKIGETGRSEICISLLQERLGCGHNEPGCTGWAEEQTVERVSLEKVHFSEENFL